jgi:spermidine synthase
LASPAQDLGPLTPERLVASLKERKIQTQFLTDFHIQRKLEKQRQEWLEESLKQGAMARLNRDAAPSGLYYGIAYWNAQFHPPMQLFWGWINGLRLGHIGLTLFLLVVMGFIWGRTFDGRRGRGAIVWVLITTGFFGTGMSILLIFSFQTFYGYTYQWIGLLVAFFMVGLALGSWRMTRTIGKVQSSFRALIRVEIIIISFGTFGLLLLIFFYAAKTEVFILQLVKFGFLFLSLISGLLVGLEFPLSSRILAGSVGGVGRPAGILYASDLIGAWAGSLLVGVILIPVLGILQTCGAIILLKIVSLSLMLFSFRRWTE